VKVEREALQLLLTDNERITSYLDDISESDFTSPARRELYREARSRTTEQQASDIAEHLSPDALALYTELVVEREPAPVEEDSEGALGEVFGRLKVFSLEREIKRRRDTLQELNPLEEAERHDALFTELVGLEARRRDLLRTLQGVS
jgi:DNA primase